MVTPTYKSWAEMKARCNNSNRKDWQNYGGRGITYDPRWEDYSAFRADMGSRPEGLSLDRINNSGHYTKTNCRWATKTEQNNKRRERARGVQRKDNTSGVPGVFQDKRRGTWYARVYEHGVVVNLYSGPSYEEAVARREYYESEQNSKIISDQIG